MARIVLVRHGETAWNVERKVMGRTDVPLNEKGISQAQTAAKALEALSIDRVFSSPQLRARQTADEIAKLQGLKSVVSEEICEVDFPKWVGMTWEELQDDEDYKVYNARKMDLDTDIFESTEKVQKRMLGAVHEAAEKWSDGNLVFVSHADPLRAVLSYGLNQDLAHLRKFVIRNGGVTVFEDVPNRWRLTMFNFLDEPFWGLSATK